MFEFVRKERSFNTYIYNYFGLLWNSRRFPLFQMLKSQSWLWLWTKKMLLYFFSFIAWAMTNICCGILTLHTYASNKSHSKSFSTNVWYERVFRCSKPVYTYRYIILNFIGRFFWNFIQIFLKKTKKIILDKEQWIMRNEWNDREHCLSASQLCKNASELNTFISNIWHFIALIFGS